MKKIHLLWIYLCISITAIHAQKTDCYLNVKEAIFYLQEEQNLPKDSLKSIQLLKPCLEKGYDKAQLLMGRLYLSKKTEEGYQKAFKLFKKAAQQENALAMADLGILYKYGRGCKLNFNKARKWFQKSAELGNSKAAYSLGYLYYKGFGTIKQDYTQAVKWFQKSDYSMAKYWLGICYLKGYGVSKNINKASELLGREFIVNTTNIITDDTLSDPINNQNTTYLNSEIQLNANTSEKEITDEFLLGNWKGTLLKLDWSKKNIEAKKDIDIIFQLDSLTGTFISKISIDKNVIEDAFLKIDETIYFENTKLSLPHESYKKSIPNDLEYTILSSDLQLKTVNGITYLIANVESYIKNWNESGAPLRLILNKKETFNNIDKELSNDALIALSQQEDNFIKLYPNPFEKDLIISYSLTEQATINVELSDLHGNTKSVIANNETQNKGDYKYYLDGTTLEKGVYVVTVLVNGKRKTRVIIKN